MEKDNQNEFTLSKESLKEDNFSSHDHAVSALAIETKEYQDRGEYQIPSQYHINTLVILPVNVNTSFVYWEVNEPFIKSVFTGEYDHFVIKMYEKAGANDNEMITFSVNGNIGKYYINFYTPNKAMYAVLGVYDKNGNFIPLLKSNMIITPSDTVNTGDEMWMSKMSDWVEIIHASLERLSIKSSASLVKEMEMLRRKQRLRIDIDTTELTTNVSSGEFLVGSSDFLGSSSMSSFNLSSDSLYKK